jgi:hypothetical protein
MFENVQFFRICIRISWNFKMVIKNADFYAGYTFVDALFEIGIEK